MVRSFYAVTIQTETGPVVSRYFDTIAAARKWAKWCGKKFEGVRIMKGGEGGVEVQ